MRPVAGESTRRIGDLKESNTSVAHRSSSYGVPKMITKAVFVASIATLTAGAGAFPAWSLASDGTAIRSGGSITLKHRAEVIGGDVQAVGKLHMQHDSWVQGSASYGTSLNAKHAAGAGGGFEQSSAPFGGAPWSIPDIGSANIDVGHDGSWTVGAGAYRNLSAKHRATVSVGAGEYVFRSISLGHDAVLNVDTTLGDVVIFSERDVSLGHRASINVAGEGSVFLVAGKKVTMGHDTTAQAAVYSLSGSVDMKDRSSLSGSIHALGNVVLGHDSSVAYRAMGPSVMASIPAPATGAMLAPGLLLLSRRRR